MSGQVKNVIIVGASGNLGKPVLKEFISSSLFKISVLSRATSDATFSSSVNVIKTDYSFDSITKAFAGQDAVVSLIGSSGLSDQKKIVDAAVKAGVKRFLPSEFGSNTSSETVRAKVPIFETKRQVVDHLRSKEKEGLTWTAVVSDIPTSTHTSSTTLQLQYSPLYFTTAVALDKELRSSLKRRTSESHLQRRKFYASLSTDLHQVTGPFFDAGLANGFLGFDAKNKTAQIWDGGNVPFSASNLSTIGKAVASLLSTSERLAATENKYIFISSHTVTQNDILSVAEKASGGEWQTEKVDSEEAGNKATEQFRSGDYSAIPELIRTAFLASDELGNWEKIGSSNDLLSLPRDDFEVDVRRSLVSV